MNLLSLFASVVFAAGLVISPIPENTPVPTPPVTKPTVTFGQITTPSPTPEAQPTPKATAGKHSYTIAFLGDSMIDTMGPDLPAVADDLKATYPATNFTLLNYGVGATNIEYGIERITNDYTYLGKQIPALDSTHPDIVVLESFAYNPFSDPDGGVNRHWLDLGKAVDTLRQNIPSVKIVIAATIGPNSAVFPGNLAAVRAYLESTVAFAKGEHLPLVDAYHPSLDRNGNGLLAYIKPGDHIHYSDAGRTFFAHLIVNTLQSVL